MNDKEYKAVIALYNKAAKAQDKVILAIDKALRAKCKEKGVTTLPIYGLSTVRALTIHAQEKTGFVLVLRDAIQMPGDTSLFILDQIIHALKRT